MVSWVCPEAFHVAAGLPASACVVGDISFVTSEALLATPFSLEWTRHIWGLLGIGDPQVLSVPHWLSASPLPLGNAAENTGITSANREKVPHVELVGSLGSTSAGPRAYSAVEAVMLETVSCRCEGPLGPRMSLCD